MLRIVGGMGKRAAPRGETTKDEKLMLLRARSPDLTRELSASALDECRRVSGVDDIKQLIFSMGSSEIKAMMGDLYRLSTYTPDTFCDVVSRHASALCGKNHAAIATMMKENEAIVCSFVYALTTASVGDNGRYNYKSVTDIMDMFCTFKEGIESARRMEDVNVKNDF